MVTPAPERDVQREHLVLLPGSRWALWRSVVLRGAGFPAATVLRLAAAETAAAADRVLQLETAEAEQRRRAIAALDAALAAPAGPAEMKGGSEERARLRAARSRVIEGRPPKTVVDTAAASALHDLVVAANDLAEARSGLVPVWANASAQTSAEIERAASWDLFREAVAWQSPGVVDRALDELVRRSGMPRNASLRRDEELVASYLQRYCVKNDTIGFFGPVGWAEIRGGGEPIAVRPGANLLEHRQVYFETWPIDVLAARLASEPGLRPNLAPRLRRGCHLRGPVLHLPGGREHPLPPAHAALLAECDGRRTAGTIAGGLEGCSSWPVLGTPEGVYALLTQLAEMGLVTWTLEVPLELHPEQALRQVLLGVEPAALRERLLAPLQELDGARQDLARAAGDAKRVQLAVRRLEETFTRLTGEPARRRHGEFYAGRGLVYEECRRSAEVAIGPELIRRLAPLGWLLASARWIAGELTRRVERQLIVLHDELRQQSGATVDSYALVARARTALFSTTARSACFTELESDLQRRWAEVLALPAPPSATPGDGGARVHRTTREIADRFAAAFSDAAPAFSLVRWFSPDVMIAARSEAAFRGGDFQLVLGEIHASNTLSWSSFVSQHPQPEHLLRNVERDLDGSLVVMPQMLKVYFTQRNNSCLVLPGFLRYEFSEEPQCLPECTSLPAAEVVVERDEGGLTARTRDGRLRFPAVELLGIQLLGECSRLLGRALPPVSHQPRVTLDELVIARERWRFGAAELGFAAEKDPLQRFLAVRRWARRCRLPRFSFYRVAGETKPCYLDLDSPIYVNLFARLVRAAGGVGAPEPLVVEEMLPAIEDAWLIDAEGSSYTCELRLAAIAAPQG